MSDKADKNIKQRNVKQISMRDHIKNKSMWAGSKNMQTIETYVVKQSKPTDGSKDNYEYSFVTEELKYPPVLLKLTDEILVNALDQWTTYPKHVTKISVSVNEDGQISVFNNGPGITVEQTKNLSGTLMYTPQLIFSEYLAGSNLDESDAKNRIVGGTNGLGAKITAIYSNVFTVETTDEINKIYYRQEFRNGLLEVYKPTLISLDDKNAVKEAKLSKEQLSGHTRITFMPNYEEFKINIKTFHKTFHKLIEMRCWEAAGYIAGSGAKIYFNETPIPIKTFMDYCQMYSELAIIETKMTNPKVEYVWDVCIGLSDNKEKSVSLINGVMVQSGGTHIQYIQNHLVENLKTYIMKELKKAKVKFNKNLLLGNLIIFMRGNIPNADFPSQTKNMLANPIESFAGYEIPSTHWQKIWKFVEPAVMSSFLKKQIGDVKMRTNRGKIEVPKYQEANFCRNAKIAHKCGLIITEGDSATGTAEKGLQAKFNDVNADYLGIFSIQGVPVNGLKESILINKKKKDKIDIESNDLINLKYVPNKKLMENERICSLIKVLGLDYNKTYKTEKEFLTLRYGYILGLTDADVDGFNIFGLLATYFMTYWPALIKHNFIRRLNTPVVRAYPKNKKYTVKEFFTEKEVKTWIAEVGDDVVQKNYTFKFYKGLATHSEAMKEVSRLFKNFSEKVCTYVLDEYAIKNMYIYYGCDTSHRKLVLATPVVDEIDDIHTIPLSKHFGIDTKLFQRDNIIRKLLNVVDGFVISRRKVFYTARKSALDDIKVASLAGDVSKLANYHHGESSVSDTIIKMAQSYPWARNLPLLLPLGNFGSRCRGYKDFGASRYVNTRLNARLADKLFRKEDEFILEYELEEGVRYEPKYYVPIIPYVLCENNEIPATGWKITTYARDINAIFKNIRDMISGKITKCGKLPIWLKDFNGEIRKYKVKNQTKECFVGNYEYDKASNTVTITELPYGKFSKIYLKGQDDCGDGILSKEWIQDYSDEKCSNDHTEIVLYLKEGAYEAINAKYGSDDFDCFEEYFELKTPITHHINLVNEKGEVIEYKSYEDVFNDWYEFRKKLYSVRVEREQILNDLEIKMLKNQQRFSKEHDNFKITNKTKYAVAEEILKTNKFNIFNLSLLNSPKYTSVKELIYLITSAEAGAGYDYLLNMSYRDLTEEAYLRREKKIKELEDRQKYLIDDNEAFKGAKIWEVELNELEQSIKTGMESQWFYGTNLYSYDSDDDKPKPKTKLKK